VQILSELTGNVGTEIPFPVSLVVVRHTKNEERREMIRHTIHNSLRKADQKRSGQALVEYIVIVAAVALISLVSVSMFGHKVADQYAIGAGMLPGAHAEDNLPITTGEYAGFAENAGGTALISNGAVSWADITGNTETGVLRNNVVVSGGNSSDAFVAE
tara:strand:- start:169 stop:645 length:477 start_codon:yes stop_codon:yes gene_type:complete